MKSINKSFTLIFSLILVILVYGGCYMYQQKYQMYVLVTPDNESDPEWPSKRKWFDASDWLKKSNFVKIDGSFVLNVKYVPIYKLNDFRISRAISWAIKESVNLEPGLYGLAQMDDDTFFSYIVGVISYEYLRTEFNSETLIPDRDYFLFFFSYKGVDYEVAVLREPYEDSFAFPYASSVHKAGYWHSSSHSGYSYRDYLEGKPIK